MFPDDKVMAVTGKDVKAENFKGLAGGSPKF